jgi:hypothetical protein
LGLTKGCEFIQIIWVEILIIAHKFLSLGKIRLAIKIRVLRVRHGI